MNHKAILPTLWKNALVRNDWADLEKNFPEEAANAKVWQIESGLSVIGYRNEILFINYEGRMTECLEFTCAENNPFFEKVLHRIECGVTTATDAEVIRRYVAEIRQLNCHH
ncbi:hypothetical protein [Nitrosomonas mobilis]|uniref:Uncharacterized protein n=1 Tax=Nitrosomonas mobilis TaxID=51642 RepID=A0A1G5SCX7_9PROT|nr:hypothetical protein [Nitrosomonas mobilis]SCZ85002.1 hypothetical protein NSMM_330022 [Nitrosomonas mobilis]HNO76336.1 hypothetical protein [Nitrosomonas mobilis]